MVGFPEPLPVGMAADPCIAMEGTPPARRLVGTRAHYLNGMANVVRSSGYASVMESEAVKNYEQAYSTDLDNRLKATSNYFQVKQMNASLRDKARGPGSSTSELAHYAQEMAPRRLTSSELDPVTGEVNWPTLLNDDRYAKLRQTVDRLFSERRVIDGGGSADYRAMSKAIEALRAAMAKHIGDYNSAAYVEAPSFSIAWNTRPVS